MDYRIRQSNQSIIYHQYWVDFSNECFSNAFVTKFKSFDFWILLLTILSRLSYTVRTVTRLTISWLLRLSVSWLRIRWLRIARLRIATTLWRWMHWHSTKSRWRWLRITATLWRITGLATIILLIWIWKCNTNFNVCLMFGKIDFLWMHIVLTVGVYFIQKCETVITISHNKQKLSIANYGDSFSLIHLRKISHQINNSPYIIIVAPKYSFDESDVPVA